MVSNTLLNTLQHEENQTLYVSAGVADWAMCPEEYMIYTNDNESSHQDMWYSAKGVLRSEGVLLIAKVKKKSLKINNLRRHK